MTGQLSPSIRTGSSAAIRSISGTITSGTSRGTRARSAAASVIGTT